MPLPHHLSASVYERVYELEFGSAYEQFTNTTLAALRSIVPSGGSIIDFGAGTGRLTIPLATQGFQVTAVEQCSAMTDVLRQKAAAAALDVTVRTQPIADYFGDRQHDVGYCVFTVISYIVDDDELRRSIKAMARSIKAGGKLLIEVPRREIFQSRLRGKKGSNLLGRVSIEMTTKDHFVYSENTDVTLTDGSTTTYTEHFSLRYWPSDYVMQLLGSAGFDCFEGPLCALQWTGGDYFICTKH